MNSKYTMALLALFIGLLVAAYFLGQDREPTNMTEGTRTPTPAPMFDLEAAAVQEVTISGADGEIMLTRVAGGWEVDGQPASDTVDGTIERLAPPDVIRVLEDRNPDDYGFATPSLTITLKTQEGTEHILLLGDDTPVDGNVYVRVGTDGPIYIVAGADITTIRGWLTDPPLAPTATSAAIEPAGPAEPYPGAGTSEAAATAPTGTPGPATMTMTATPPGDDEPDDTPSPAARVPAETATATVVGSEPTSSPMPGPTDT